MLRPAARASAAHGREESAMNALPRGHDTVELLIAKGVSIPNPGSLDIGPEVDPARISGKGVTIYPGCRIYGAQTVISAGCALGAEGPVTIDNCQLGADVALKGGYFAGSVFLARANMGLGAHVREGTILEEEAGGAHCVGLKQTILFPFVTLGSLINFCDCLMSGGTSRSDHSEVGSSYIHFNFTPDGDKTTASLFGDVARGVMLDQPAIFLGGQGGAVGPVQTGYGTVVAVGSILRSDVPDDGMLVMVEPLPGRVRPLQKHGYKQLARILERNLTYIASLDALSAWYDHARRPFFAEQELGDLVLEGAFRALISARRERTKRLAALVTRVEADTDGRRELKDNIAAVLDCFGQPADPPPDVLASELAHAAAAGTDYIAAIKSLSPEAAAAGVAWLQGIVDERCARAAALTPSLPLFATA